MRTPGTDTMPLARRQSPDFRDSPQWKDIVRNLVFFSVQRVSTSEPVPVHGQVALGRLTLAVRLEGRQDCRQSPAGERNRIGCATARSPESFFFACLLSCLKFSRLSCLPCRTQGTQDSREKALFFHCCLRRPLPLLSSCRQGAIFSGPMPVPLCQGRTSPTDALDTCQCQERSCRKRPSRMKAAPRTLLTICPSGNSPIPGAFHKEQGAPGLAFAPSKFFC